MRLLYMPNSTIEQAIAEKRKQQIKDLKEKKLPLSESLIEEEATNPFFGTLTNISDLSIIECNRVCANPVVNAAINAVVGLVFDDAVLLKVNIKKARRTQRAMQKQREATQNSGFMQQQSQDPQTDNSNGYGNQSAMNGNSMGNSSSSDSDSSSNDDGGDNDDDDDADTNNGKSSLRKPLSKPAPVKRKLQPAKPPDPTKYKPDVNVEEIIRQRDSPTEDELKERSFLRNLGETLLREYLKYGIAVLCVHQVDNEEDYSIVPLNELVISFCTRADSTRNYFCARKHSTLSTVMYEPRYYLCVISEPTPEGKLVSGAAVIAHEYINFEVLRASATVSSMMQLIPVAYSTREIKPTPAYVNGSFCTDKQLDAAARQQKSAAKALNSDGATAPEDFKAVPVELLTSLVGVMNRLNGPEALSVFQTVLTLVTKCIDTKSALMSAPDGDDVVPMPKPALIDIAPQLASFVELVANSFQLPPDFYSFQTEKLKAQAEGSQKTKSTCVSYHTAHLETFFDALVNSWLSIPVLRAQDKEATESDVPIITVDPNTDPITATAGVLLGGITSESRMVLETPLSLNGPVTRTINEGTTGEATEMTLDQLLKIKEQMINRAGKTTVSDDSNDDPTQDLRLKERILIIQAPPLETIAFWATLGVVSTDALRLFASLHLRVPPSFLNSEPTFPVLKEGPVGGEGKEKKPRLVMETIPGTEALSKKK